MDATDWIRQGECNGCGECCRQATNCIDVLIPIKDEAYGRMRFGAPVTLPPERQQQLSPEQQAGLLFRARGPVYLPCPQLQGNLCSINDTKPQFCRDWPTQPEDIEQLGCSYWFVHRTTGEIKGTVGLDHQGG